MPADHQLQETTSAPPVCLDAERRVLGTLLVFFTPKVLHQIVTAGVTPEAFWYVEHGAVFRAVERVAERDGYADALTVGRFLAGQKHGDGSWLDRVGGEAVLQALSTHADANGFLGGARVVAEDARLRELRGVMYAGLDAIERRDLGGFWLAMEGVREGAAPGRLKVIDGGREAA